MLLTSALAVLALSGVAAALPSLAEEFREDPTSGLQARLVLTVPALFVLLAAPLAGVIVDSLGRKRLLLAALALYGVAGLWPLVARSLPEILVSRAVLGIALSGVMTSVTTVIADLYDGQARARMLGYQQATIGVLGALLLALGGMLTMFGARAPFVLHAVALALLPLVVAFIPEPGRQSGFGTSPPFRLTALGRRVAPLFALGFFVQAAYTIVPVQLPFALPEVMGASPAESGLAIASLVLFYALGALLASAAVERSGAATVLGAAFFAVGLCYLLIWRADGWPLLVVGLVLAGIAFGFILPTLTASVAAVAPLALRGRVFGSFSTVMFIGQFASPLLAQPVIALVGIRGLFGVVGALLLALGAAAALAGAGRRALARTA